MSLDFVIIPITNMSFTNAHDIKHKLNDNVKLDLNIIIDDKYEMPVNSRVALWKKKDYDIITVDNDYQESSSIVVRFSEKGSKPQVMNIEEFIDLIVSYEYEETAKLNTDSNSGGCVIM
jgi:hypothetical protein